MDRYPAFRPRKEHPGHVRPIAELDEPASLRIRAPQNA